MADRIRVGVVYVDPQTQIEKWVDVPVDSTAGEAIAASGIADALPPGFTPTAIGIYGSIVDEHHRVRDGDRIELYRPLVVDPKEARRRRARR